MTDIDLPLEDIINKKKVVLRRNKPAAVTNKVAPLANASAQPNINRPNTGDVRNHLIQKKRLQLNDAREQLAKIAKTSDARDKLNKIRGKPDQQQGGIPQLLDELQSKPTDMRQKLDLKRNGPLQIMKSNVQQVKPTLQTANRAGAGTTRMQGNAIVRTVSGNASANTTAAPRRTIQNRTSGGSVQKRLLTNTIQNRGVSSNSINIQRNRLGNKGVSGSVMQQFHNNNVGRIARQPVTAPTMVTLRSTAPAGAQVIRTARPMQRLARRVVPLMSNGAVYTTRPRQATVMQPQAVYRQLSSRMPSYRPNTVVVQHQEPLLYEDEPAIMYEEEEPLEYDDQYDIMDPQDQPIYYDDVDAAPAYEPEYEEVYVPRMVSSQPQQQQQQQQHYGPPMPPQSRPAVYTQNSNNYMPRAQPRLQQSRLQQPQQQPQQMRFAPQPQQQQQTRFSTQQQQQPRFNTQQQQQQQPRFSTQQQQQQQQPRFNTQQQQQQPRFNTQQQQQQQQPRYSTQQRSQPQQRSVQQPQRRPVSARTAPAAVPKVVGHRVVVSNLHPVATNEDIEELFGNIGSITSCKMNRPGTATVVFLNLSEAQKSVEVYHNRKLDGQPMQVKIVGTVTDSTSIISRSARGRVY